jgi:AcrR family transcriptional regulator
MGRLASAVGMSKSGLYAHFASKEELQLATISHFLDVFNAEVLEDPAEDPDNRLGRLLERWLHFFQRKAFPGGCFLIVAAVEFASRRGPVRDALQAALEQEIDALATAIRRAVKAGEIRPVENGRQTAFELHCILVTTHALFHIQDDPAVFKRARKAIRRVLA